MENRVMWERKVKRGKLESPDLQENRQEVIFIASLRLSTLSWL
jgi:hypothetical protein